MTIVFLSKIKLLRSNVKLSDDTKTKTRRNENENEMKRRRDENDNENESENEMKTMRKTRRKRKRKQNEIKNENESKTITKTKTWWKLWRRRKQKIKRERKRRRNLTSWWTKWIEVIYCHAKRARLNVKKIESETQFNVIMNEMNWSNLLSCKTNEIETIYCYAKRTKLKQFIVMQNEKLLLTSELFLLNELWIELFFESDWSIELLFTSELNAMTRVEKLDATTIVVYNLIELKTKDFELYETCNESKSWVLNSFKLYKKSLNLTNSFFNESTTKRRRE